MTAINNISTIMDTTRKLFQGARNQHPEQFQDWALEQVKDVISFDSAKWVSGSIHNNIGISHSEHTFNLPDTLMDDYFPRQNQDALLAKLLSNPGCTYDLYEVIPRDQWMQLKIYKNYCKVYGIEQAVSTAIPDPVTNLLTVISLYRKNENSPFSLEEKQAKESLSATLADARNMNLFLHLKQPNQHASSCSAICDAKGILREAEPSFSDLMLKEWPEWRGPQLNFIPEEILSGGEEAQFSGERITINISIQHDLILLQARKKNRLDSLTPAEKAVADHLMQGLSNKEIANNLNISPKTVSHHLQSIYKKTSVANRQQVIAQLKGQL